MSRQPALDAMLRYESVSMEQDLFAAALVRWRRDPMPEDWERVLWDLLGSALEDKIEALEREKEECNRVYEETFG